MHLCLSLGGFWISARKYHQPFLEPSWRVSLRCSSEPVPGFESWPHGIFHHFSIESSHGFSPWDFPTSGARPQAAHLGLLAHPTGALQQCDTKTMWPFCARLCAWATHPGEDSLFVVNILLIMVIIRLLIYIYMVIYPLVNDYIAMERSTIFNGQFHYFHGHFQ